MRIFDITGAAAVAFWLIFTGLYVYRHEVQSTESETTSLEGDVTLSEGDSWMILRRNDEDVGFVHRTRTRLENGWLTEYDMLMVVDVLGQKRPIDIAIKARLDEEAYLNGFDADIRASGRRIAAQGDVQADNVSLIINPKSDPIQRSIPLNARPRLATHSFHQLLARDELEPGDRYENEYFDPTSLGMQSIVIEYVGRESVDVFGQQSEAYHLKQTVNDEHYDVYVNERGELLIQEFPFEIVGARVKPELGRARAADIRQRAASARSDGPDETRRIGSADLETAFDMLGLAPGQATGGGQAPPDDAGSTPDASGRDASTGDPSTDTTD